MRTIYFLSNLCTNLCKTILGSQRREDGAIWEEATIEHPLSTHSASIGTRWSQAGYLHALRMCAVLLVLLFTLGVGETWADTNTFQVSGTFKDIFGINSGSTLSANNYTVNGTSWSFPALDYFGYSGTTYYQFGTAKKPVTSCTLSTSAISGSISQVVVRIYGASDVSGTVSVSVGGTAYKYNTNYTSASFTATATNYTFTGSSTGTLSVTFGQSTSKAIYLASITTTYSSGYTITYNANGGSGTMSNTTGASVSAAANGFTAPAGKQFTGWNTASGGGGTAYAAGASVNATVTLYAQWSCITPTISGHPAAATYWDMDSPTALTVTASGGTLSYQWQMSADGSSSWSNVGTNSSSYTPSVANGTKYYRCIVTNTGSSCNTTATSNNALVTIKTLSSIAVKTSPKTTYFAGEMFSPTNLVITLTASDASTQDRSYASYSSGFTFSPTTATALTTSDDVVSITYGGESVDLDINVYSVTVNKVDDAGNSISADGVSASWTVGTKALAASYGSTQYRFYGWAFDGSNNGLSITSTSSANTTITGTPTGNVTIKAVFYAPRVVKWSVDGDDSYETGSPTKSVPYGTTWSALTLPTDPTFSCGDKFMGWTTTNIGATGLDKDDDADDITALDLMTNSNKSGKTASKYQITGTSITFYGVIADYVDE